MSTLTLALIQQEITWLDKGANLASLHSQLRPISDVDLILLPETFATGFAVDADCAEPEQGLVLKWMKQTAAEKNAVIAGSVLVEYEGKKANRFYWVWPDGKLEYYDKRHLFCLGNEGEYVRAGQKRHIITINGFRILPQVCYDLRFPVFQRNRNDYDVMVNVANWPAARRHVWDTLLMARAMENVSYVIGVNRIGADGNKVAHSGGTAVIDFKGSVLARAKDDTHDTLVFTLEKAPLEQFRAAFPAHLDSDDFSLKL